MRNRRSLELAKDSKLFYFYRVFRKLHQPTVSQAALHPGYSISKYRLRYCRSDGSAQYWRDGDIQSLLGATVIFFFRPEIGRLRMISDGPTYEQALSESVEPSQKIEPFKENVENIKELYNNIQNEINRLKEGN